MPQNGPSTSVPKFFAFSGTDFSSTVPTTPIVLIPQGIKRNYLLVVNVGLVSHGSAWLSWFGLLGPNVPGSFCLAPRGNAIGQESVMEFGLNGGVIPQLTLMAISDGGSSGSAPAYITATVF